VEEEKKKKEGEERTAPELLRCVEEAFLSVLDILLCLIDPKY
jgi:hypothetical protein